MNTTKKIVDMLYEIINDKINDPDLYIPDLVKEALKNADTYQIGIVSYDIRTDKINVWSKEPNQFLPDFEEYQVELFRAETNWVANENWEFEDVLGKKPPKDVDDEWKWADEEAKRQGYEDFDDALAERFAGDIELEIPEDTVLQSYAETIRNDSNLLLSILKRYIEILKKDLRAVQKRIEIVKEEQK